jgi:hypothetical protein
LIFELVNVHFHFFDIFFLLENYLFYLFIVCSQFLKIVAHFLLLQSCPVGFIFLFDMLQHWFSFTSGILKFDVLLLGALQFLLELLYFLCFALAIRFEFVYLLKALIEMLWLGWMLIDKILSFLLPLFSLGQLGLLLGNDVP